MIPLHCLLVTLAWAQSAPAQDSAASITGQIRDRHDEPVANALIRASGTRREARSDALGRFDLRGLPAGRIDVRVNFIGYAPTDTTLSLRRGQRVVWNVVLRESSWAVQAARDDSIRIAAGGLDSVGAGLVVTDTASAFTYERFGIRLLGAAVNGSRSDSSRVLSPLSAGQALALALAAAKDSTALAIARTLELGRLGSEGIAARSKRFNDAVRRRRDVTLKVANALWVDTSATLQPQFAGWAGARYDAVVRTLPLRVPQVVPVLNHWADSATNGAIRAIRDKPFGANVEVVLTNAVYFKGRWLEPFDSSNTRDRPFTSASGQKIVTPTMERTSGVAYRRASQYQVIRLPYAAGLTALYVVLPDSGVSAVRILDELARTGWPTPDLSKEAENVQIRLPKLHLTQATDLRPPLTALGMGIVFDSTRADFGGLVVPRPNEPPPCPPLSSGISLSVCTRYRISDAHQHVFLDVDEQGTEAAAVSSMELEGVVISVPPPPIKFFVDRPFLFALRDERTGTLLFAGFIAAPRQ